MQSYHLRCLSSPIKARSKSFGQGGMCRHLGGKRKGIWGELQPEKGFLPHPTKGMVVVRG